MAVSLEAWFQSIPPVTKYLFLATIGITLCANYSIGPLTFANLYWDVQLLWEKFHFWRLVSPFFIHGLGMSFLIDLFYLYTYSKSLEEEKYQGLTASYVYHVLLLSLGCLFAATFMKLPYLGHMFIMTIVYVWSRTWPEANASFFFGIKFKAKFLPFVLLVANVMLGQSPINDIIAILVGHFFFVCHSIIPDLYGIDVTKPPIWIQRIIPTNTHAGVNFGEAINRDTIHRRQTATTSVAQTQGYRWGSGHALGS
eukprot:TRINITY_DN1876_c0_g1_i1.p1 TRINITY_DN1876_c0_g1~~TRINITY_DN1876_c0_g1_i1.p1  ORF type:complete len:298 (+),score=19.90 TRINITY_DN1876_c0_g1_i1:134-895(+)